MDVRVARDIVPVVLQRGRVKRQNPDGRDSEVAQVVQLFSQPAEVPDAVPVTVVESADVDLIEDRVLVPERIAVELEGFFFAILHDLAT